MSGTSTALICEYNPFHFGHLYQLKKLKERFDTVVCILGGELTQRGEVAIASRHTRAKVALEHGADLVLELPAPYCCASAREFARGGVSIAKAIGVDALSFSAESDEETLRFAASKRAEAEREANELLRTQKNLSYPKALETVLGKQLLGCPNDILGIEYLCAAGDGLQAHIIKREPSFASSTSIRAQSDPASLLPPNAGERFRADPAFPRVSEEMGKFLLATLRNGVDAEVYAVPPELYAKIRAEAANARSLEELVRSCANRVYTHARVRRAVWSLVFSFPKEFPEEVPFTRLLACNANGREFLRRHEHARELIAHRRADEPIYALNERIDAVLRLFYPDIGEEKPYLI